MNTFILIAVLIAIVYLLVYAKNSFKDEEIEEHEKIW